MEIAKKLRIFSCFPLCLIFSVSSNNWHEWKWMKQCQSPQKNKIKISKQIFRIQKMCNNFYFFK
jgi:hypothetical protein